ncbi:MAG: type III-B CRISPR-associated protein Cas10/Cmr2 [Pseudomonadota bacterium]|nr:type III-B CRISPR-associated protein Cas10/Cmr2 [Pseudomonadota bacterium]
MNNHLFLFTIGPVQSFIAQARKTQDLYAGSQILSDLCRVGIEAIKSYRGKVIFPYESNKFLPNRFLAEINQPESDLEKIGIEIEKKVKTEFKQQSEKVLNKYNIHKPPGFDEQIDNHLDIHWIFYPIKENYSKAYREIERLLGAIKNTRTFEQLKDGAGEQGRKCSLDGERNALFYRRNNQGKVPAFIQKDAVELKKETRRLHPNEALSAVSFVKRFYGSEEFTSITTVSLMNYMEQLENAIKSNEDAKNILDDKLLDKFGVKSIRDKKLETGIFYEENLTSKYFREHDLDNYIKNDIPYIRECVIKLNKLATKTAYYAVLVFDADEMGQWLSGNFLKNKDELKAFHLTLSEKLSSFADIAAKKLVYPCGQTIYAGGDDFLGFVNLDDLFEVIMSLRQCFDCLVNQPLKIFERQNENKNLTFSAGILIAHYKEPLHMVLQEARRLEQVAKEEGGRDAFAMGVMKHSGESHQMCYKWKQGQEWNIERLQYFIKQLQENFSDTFIRNLNLELSALVEEDDKDEYHDIKNDERLFIEMKRLIIRSVQEEHMKTKIVTPLNDILSALWDSGKQSSHDKPKNFLDMLNIANFLVKKGYAK